jgi:outer membrane protein assembly factor BamB
MLGSRRLFLRIASVVSCLILAACHGGGGGGGGSAGSSSATAAPYILATVISFPTTNVPAGFVPAGFNSGASVEVLDSSSGAPITNASVSVNGVPLAYDSANQDYEGGISVNPASSVSLSVTVGSTTYTASATQFTSYPTITSPLAGTTWSSFVSNLAAWSGVAPTASSLYALGVVDTNGQLLWPSGNVVQVLPTTTTSYPIPPYSLSAGNRLVIVGLTDLVDIPNADPNSGLIIGGFNYVPITVINRQIATLLSIAVTPNNLTITAGKTQQLTVTGSYSDGSTQDLTTQITWQSSDPTKATISSTGVVTGQNYGSTTVMATYGGISGSTLVNVFQLNPSPTPPLSQAVTYQIDYAHSGNAVFPNPITFPSSATWSTTLNGATSYPSISYPLIAGGMVYVTTSGLSLGGGTYGAWLYALDEQTGHIVWGPIALSSDYSTSASAYDHGKIFVINYDGLLRSFDAATGTPGWSTQLPGQWAFTSPPTAINGIVYVGGAGSGGTLYAVDEATGNVLWTATVWNGDYSSPAVSSDGVFVSYPCQVYKFDPITGTSLWHYSGPCEGGGGETSVYANGLLYVRDFINFNSPFGQIYDATSGTRVGTFNVGTSQVGPIPAIGTTTGFFLNSGSLQAIDLTSHNILWSFTGDGSLVSDPIVINQDVIVGSSSGNVYAIDATTGLQIWKGNAGSAIAGNDNHALTPTGFGAGEGYLVVPAGNVLTAWKLSGP